MYYILESANESILEGKQSNRTHTKIFSTYNKVKRNYGTIDYGREKAKKTISNAIV